MDDGRTAHQAYTSFGESASRTLEDLLQSRGKEEDFLPSIPP